MLGGADLEEIEICVKIILLNLNCKNEHAYIKWSNYALSCMNCIDYNTGAFVHLPEKGGYYDQDYFTISVWEAVKQSYFKLINSDEIKKHNQIIKGKNG